MKTTTKIEILINDLSSFLNAVQGQYLLNEDIGLPVSGVINRFLYKDVKFGTASKLTPDNFSIYQVSTVELFNHHCDNMLKKHKKWHFFINKELFLLLDKSNYDMIIELIKTEWQKHYLSKSFKLSIEKIGDIIDLNIYHLIENRIDL